MDAELTPTNTEPLTRFNFGDAGHVNAEQLRMLRSLDEQLARNLTHALSAWLRTDVAVTAEPQTHQTFREFLEHADESYMLPVHLPEMHATALLRWPLPLAAQMIELLLGGSGGSTGDARDLTEIEEEIFLAVLDVVLREWNKVWQKIALRMQPGERSRNAGERQLLTAAEKVYGFHLGLVIGEVKGSICLCVPAPVLASVMRRVPLLQQSAHTHTEAHMEALLTVLRDASVRTGLCFPPVRVSASRLQNLRAGSTLVLPLPSNTAAEFRISEVPVATAAPARVGAWRAANITALRDAGVPRGLLPRSSAATRAEEVETYA